MQLNDIQKLLEKIGYPVRYHHFKKPPEPPYIVYLIPGSNNFSADNKVYQEINAVQIELYTDKKEPAAEKKVKALLDEVEMFYETSETFIESESLYQVIFETSQLGE